MRENTRKTRVYKAVFIAGIVMVGLLSISTTITAKTISKTLSFDGRIETQEAFARGAFEGVSVSQHDDGAMLGVSNGKSGVYVSPVVTAPFVANYIGLHWEEDVPYEASLVTYLRTSTNGVDFTEWVETSVEDDLGPNGFVAEETFAALVGIQKSAYAQAKIEFIPAHGVTPTVRSLTLTFINTAEESEQEVKKLAFVGQAIAEVFTNPAQKTSLHGETIDVVSRAQWGADETLRFEDGNEIWPRSYHGTRKIAVHHTAGASSNRETDLITNIDTVEAIYHYHAVTQGWGDIGYNALIDAAGNIYEGRYGTHGENALTDDDVLVLDIEAAHASGYNTGTFGLAAMGDFTYETVTVEQSQAIEDLITYVADSRGINVERGTDFLLYNNSWVYGLPNVFSHRDVGDTACPGDEFYAEINNTLIPNVANRLSVLSSEITGLMSEATLIEPLEENNISGENIGASSLMVSWDAVVGADQYEYRLEKVVGVVDVEETSELWEDAWFTLDNTLVTSEPAVSFETSSLDDMSEYVFYVRALFEDSPVSHVVHIDFVKDENNIFIDNLAVRYVESVGDWTHSTNVSGFYGADYQPNAAGVGNDYFEWSHPLFKDGYYDVFVMYTIGADRDRRVPYTVFSMDENSGVEKETTVIVNQKEDGGVWVPIGNYYFNQSNNAVVQLSDNIRRGYVIADAVRFTFDRTGSEAPVNELPVADAGVDQMVTLGTVVSFDGSDSTDDGELVYEWSFGDGAIGEGETVTHEYLSAGTYNVTLTITDTESETDTDDMTVVVNEQGEVQLLHIDSVVVTLQSRGVFTTATAVVTVLDSVGNPVDQAMVYGQWSGASTDGDEAMTGVSGEALVVSDKVKSASEDFVFTVTDVVKDGWEY